MFNNSSTQMGQGTLAEMVRSLGVGIAQAQFEMGRNSTRLMRRFAGEDAQAGATAPEEENSLIDLDGRKYSLLELGFMPAFYTIRETVIDIKISLSMNSEEELSRPTDANLSGGVSVSRGIFSTGASAHLSFMSAATSSKYQYKAESASSLHTRLVPVPPPVELQERLQRLREKP